MDGEDGGAKRSGRGRGRTRGSRGRGRARGRGRGKKSSRVISSDEEEDVVSPEPEKSDEDLPEKIAGCTVSGGKQRNAMTIEVETPAEPTTPSVPLMPPVIEPEPELPATTVSAPLIIDMEADISQLEAPTFTTISRGPPEPMLRLNWSHRVNLIGEKVLNPMIYCCDQCDKPILIYGRMIPCKHVFCLRCARSDMLKVCPRCKEKVIRVEQTALGTVFMCTHGGTRYGNTGCRRTYLSQRDLLAHINHRHVTNPPLLSQPAAPSVAPAPIATNLPTMHPHELSPINKLLPEKGGRVVGASPHRKNSCEQLNSPRTCMIRGSGLPQNDTIDNYYNYSGGSSYSSTACSGSQHIHLPMGGSQQQSGHALRANYAAYTQQTSPQQSSSASSSSIWSQSTSLYYR